ncbi:MAG: type III pantothenate kinase [Candidatus Dormibacteria bacterium]
MLLAIDVGNTHTAVGVFDSTELVAHFRIHTDNRSTGDELGLVLTDLLRRRDISTDAIDAVAVSNVVPALSRAVDELSRAYLGVDDPLVVGPGIRSGLRILYDDPRQVGADRIANAIAAAATYGGPAILVDFGTATTFDALNAGGDYLGGAIAPGIAVSHDALVSHAAKLNPVDLVAPPSAIGRTTTTSVQAGLVYGHVGVVEELVARMTTELDASPRVIATGGLAPLMAPLTRCIDTVDQQLTLTGLRLIHERNAG